MFWRLCFTKMHKISHKLKVESCVYFKVWRLFCDLLSIYNQQKQIISACEFYPLSASLRSGKKLPSSQELQTRRCVFLPNQYNSISSVSNINKMCLVPQQHWQKECLQFFSQFFHQNQEIKIKILILTAFFTSKVYIKQDAFIIAEFLHINYANNTRTDALISICTSYRCMLHHMRNIMRSNSAYYIQLFIF